MKSTDMARKNRDLKKAMKKEDVLIRKQSKKSDRSPGDFIKDLAELFIHDDVRIFNIKMSDDIQELLMDVLENVEEKHWDGICRKAVKKTGIKEKEAAFTELKTLLEELNK